MDALRRLVGDGGGDAAAVASPAPPPPARPAPTPRRARLAARPPSAQAAFAEVTALAAGLMEIGDYDAATSLAREAILGGQAGGAAPAAAAPDRPGSATTTTPSLPAPATLSPSALPAPLRPPAVPFPPGLEGTDFRPCPPPPGAPRGGNTATPGGDRALSPPCSREHGRGEGGEKERGPAWWYSSSRGLFWDATSGVLGDAASGAWSDAGAAATGAEAAAMGRG